MIDHTSICDLIEIKAGNEKHLFVFALFDKTIFVYYPARENNNASSVVSRWFNDKYSFRPQ